MTATLRDVCRRARVSSATVSRVLNGSPLVAPATRERVRRAMAALDYHPSQAARSLASARSRTLAVLFPGIASGFYSEVLCGMDEVASEHEYHLLIAFSHGPEDQERLFIRCLRERRADALVVLNLNLPDELARTAAQQATPIVFVDRPVPGQKGCWVGIDNATGARLATQHLLDRGYRRIAVITGPRDSYDAQQRLAACQATLQRAGPSLEPSLVWQGAFTEESGAAAMERWLRAGRPLPEAIFATNDAMALGAWRVLKEHGRRVPQDVALVGFDDCESARHLDLTTVRVPMRQMGRVAVELALARIQKQEPAKAQRLVPTTLVVRQSTPAIAKGVSP
jgi:LacI family transcriptional regulator